jgi:excisionase family DNA binding protein
MGELINLNVRRAVAHSENNSLGGDALFDNSKVFLTYAELSSIANIPVRTLYDYVKRGLIAPLRFGNKSRFDRDEVIDRLRKIGRGNNVQRS